MKWESIMVKGVLAFDDLVTVDLTPLPDGAVVAIVGGNGEGKTTLVDCLLAAIWRTMPFRDKPLLDYAHGRDSFVATVVSMDTHRYRARVNLDGVRRTTEAVLECDGQPITDGKVTTFDAAVRERFPRLRTVLASAFSAQNRKGSFVEQDRKGRKELFADMLGLDQYERWATTARAQAAIVGSQRDVAQARRDEVAKVAGADIEADLQARADSLQAAIGTLDERRATITSARATLAAERPRVAQDAERHAAATADLARLAGELAGVEAERTRLTKTRGDLARQAVTEQDKAAETFISTFQGLIKRGRQAEGDRDRAQAESDKHVGALKKDRDTRIANNRALLADAATVRAQAAEAERAEALLVDRRAELRQADEALERAARDATERSRIVTRLSDAPGALARAEQDAGLVASVPCGGQGQYAACSFLQRATSAAGRLADLRGDLDTYQEAVAQRDEAEQAYLAAKVARAAGFEAVSDAEAAVSVLNGAVKKVAALDVAEAKIAEHERAIAEAKDAHQRAYADATIRYEAALDQLHDEGADALARFHYDLAYSQSAEREGQREIDAALKLVATTHQTLTEQQAAAGHVAADTALAASRLTQIDAEDARQADWWAESEASRGRLEAEQAALEDARARLLTHRATLRDLDGQLVTLEQDLIEWQALARIFHRDGLPTLLIAAAGPEVASLTNDLLQASFGSRFVVDLVTQEAKVSGKGMKETFTLAILDAERGGDPRDLTDLSGGERVIVDEALKAALALYQRRHQAQPIETCVRDETTSALDATNRDRYVPMLRRLMALGGFKALLYVTHDEALAAHADAQIQVRKGTVRLVYPPFDVEAAA